MKNQSFAVLAEVNSLIKRLFSQAVKSIVRLWPIILVISLAGPGTLVLADTAVCGEIATDTTWTTAGSPYIVTCDVIVKSGVKLTVQSSVVVKFDSGTSLRVDGTLVATGATFTSNSVTPAKGDWGRIYFTTSSKDAVYGAGGSYSSGSKIQNSLIEWGGGGTNISGAIETNLASPHLDHNTIQYSWTSGIHAIGRSASTPIVISQNSFSYNEGYYVYGAGIYVSSGKVISNTISNNGGLTVAQGGGIFATASTIAGNIITANTARTGWETNGGGGVYSLGSTITGNTINGNAGGGVYASSSTLSGNTISGNNIGWCSGVQAIGNSTVANNTVENNTAASGDGGGICAEGGLVTSNTVRGNSSPNKGGGIYAHQATVTGNVISANNGGSGGGIYGDDANLTGNTLKNNNASSDGGGLYVYGSTNVTGNTIQGNTAGRGGGIFGDWVGYAAPSLEGNTIRNNKAASGAGIYAIGAVINGNVVTSNTASGNGGGIYAEEGTLTGNTLTANTVPSYGHGSGAYIINVTEFSYNDVLTNTATTGTAGGITVSGQPLLQYNNLYGNSPYDAEVISSDPVAGTHNYWGLSPCTAIPAQIYDGNDVPGRGKLKYAPSLYSPAPLAQLAAPANLTLTPTASGVKLSWTPLPPIPNVGCRVPGSSAPDLTYRVYYDSDSACAPFDGTGLPPGPSPINVGTASHLNLASAPQAGIVFVATAYDYLGRESHYSNLVGSLSEDRRLFLPLTVR